MKEYAVGVDVGGSHLCSSVIEVVTGEVCTEPVATPVDSKGGAAGVIAGLCGNVLETMNRFGGNVPRIGLAFPGPFDYDRGVSMIRGVSKYDGLFGLDVRESLRSCLQPEIGPVDLGFVNDASAFALGECLGGAARENGRVLALTLGTGLGSGFVDSKRLVVSGETVPANGWVYCLPFDGGIADDAFSTRWIVRRFRELTRCDVSGAKEVADRCAFDESAVRLFAEFGSRLAEFVAPLSERFGAERIVLGGNIAKAFPFFKDSLTEGLAINSCGAEVSVSKLMDKAALTGAASLFR